MVRHLGIVVGQHDATEAVAAEVRVRGEIAGSHADVPSGATDFSWHSLATIHPVLNVVASNDDSSRFSQASFNTERNGKSKDDQSPIQENSIALAKITSGHEPLSVTNHGAGTLCLPSEFASSDPRQQRVGHIINLMASRWDLHAVIPYACSTVSNAYPLMASVPLVSGSHLRLPGVK